MRVAAVALYALCEIPNFALKPDTFPLYRISALLEQDR